MPRGSERGICRPRAVAAALGGSTASETPRRRAAEARARGAAEREGRNRLLERGHAFKEKRMSEERCAGGSPWLKEAGV